MCVYRIIRIHIIYTYRILYNLIAIFIFIIYFIIKFYLYYYSNYIFYRNRQKIYKRGNNYIYSIIIYIYLIKYIFYNYMYLIRYIFYNYIYLIRYIYLCMISPYGLFLDL